MKDLKENIPSGNVTFLFTDIEGSTKLSQEFPDSLQTALEIHHGLIQKVIEANKGFVFEIVGDAFCCAFENAEDAVKAAVEAQLSLADEKWKDAVIRIRIGIHTGNAVWNGQRYTGYLTLARTARVMTAAYGEQIIISNDTYEKIKEKMYDTNQKIFSLPNQPIWNETNGTKKFRDKNISFRDLGERRLKDVIQPIRLYQIISDGLREEFPPLKTLDARPNNLPVQLTNFIGREKEIKHAKELLNKTRLLTLTGSGGSGKTRFALQTGADLIDDFENGLCLIELAAINEPELIPQIFLTALYLNEDPNKSLIETITEYLRDKEILIILDNCEHLIDACAVLTESLLSSCPKLKIIATSREALNCAGEQTYRIPPLRHPDPNQIYTPDQLMQYEAIRLFADRALSVNPDFEINISNANAISKISCCLDGVPLALELAAARTKVLSPEKIFERLDDIFNLLKDGRRTALPRQQTLRALIDWSYDLLSEHEKILWSRLSVFSGSWTLEAAEEICTDETFSSHEILDLLSQLTEKSIIIYDDVKERYRILGSMKQYGREKLEDENNIFLKHLNYYYEYSQKVFQEIKNNNEIVWLNKLEADHNNFRSAIEWSVKNENVEKGALCAASLGRFWDIRGYISTGIRLLEFIYGRSDELSKSAKIKVLRFLGLFKYRKRNFIQSKKYQEDCLALSREAGDKYGIVYSLIGLGNIARIQGDHEQAQKYYEESLGISGDIKDRQGIADSIFNLGNVAYAQGNLKQAQEYYEESHLISMETGNKSGIAHSIFNLGNIEQDHGNLEKSQKYFEKSLDIYRDTGDKNGIADCLHNLGIIARHQGNFEKAQQYHEECLSIFRNIGSKSGIANSYINLGNLAHDMEDHSKAQQYYEESLVLFQEIGFKQGIAGAFVNLGNLAKDQINFERAKNYYGEGLNIFREINDQFGIAVSLTNLGDLAQHQEDFELSKKYLKESLFIFRKKGDRRSLIITLAKSGITEYSTGNFEKAQKYFDECLTLSLETDEKIGIVISLNYLAGKYLESKKYNAAVILLSASENAFNDQFGEFNKADRNRRSEIIEKLKKHLSGKEFEMQWKEGKKQELEETVKLILDKNL